MKAWLKGGLIGECILAISFLFLLTKIGWTCPDGKECYPNTLHFISYPVNLGGFQCGFVTGCLDQCYACFPIGLLISLIELFIIGALIGLAIEKIKSK